LSFYNKKYHWLNEVAVNMISKILWAVDPFCDVKIARRTALVLKTLADKTGAQVDPVYVLTPSQINTSQGSAKWNDYYGPMADEIIKNHIFDLVFSNVAVSKVVISRTNSTRSSVIALLDEARRSAASLIMVSSHSRPGFAEFFVGSFAETLLLYSNIPIVVTNPSTEPITELDRIFFPTNFGSSCRKGFNEALSFAKQCRCRMTLYYKVPRIRNIFPATGEYYDPGAGDLDLFRPQGNELIDIAKEQDVSLDVLIDDVPGDVSSSILMEANKEKSSIIAMVSHAGPISSVILGSNARKVIRASKLPVWVIHIPD
jgi:nucleotide-binding universal stress UspA family protein